MKVCVISSIFPPYTRGGAETVAYASAKAYSKDHEVIVIACAPYEGWASFAGGWNNENRMRIFRFTPFNLFSIFNIAKHPFILRLIWHVLDMLNLHTYLVVRRVLRDEKPDLILTHNLKGLGYTVPWAIKNIKWFHTVHDMALLHPTGLRIYGDEKSMLQENPLVALYAWINKKLFGSPSVVISPSQFLLDEYRAHGFFTRSRTAVVRNPVMLEEPEILVDTKSSKDGVIRFLYLGQLESYKGIKLLLEVWRQFSAAHKEIELLVVGAGSLQEEVQEIVSRLARAKFLGFIAHEKLGEIFSQVHFTVIPSYAYENAPTTIGESIAAGVPVIASRIGGIPELVDDGNDGILFNPGDTKELLQALDKALQCSWEKLNKKAMQSALTFSSENYYRKIQELCGSL